jgi:hypothetical protein
LPSLKVAYLNIGNSFIVLLILVSLTPRQSDSGHLE